MLKKTLILAAFLICICACGIADGGFLEAFFAAGSVANDASALDEKDAGLFICLNSEDADGFLKSGTGVMLIGSAKNDWTREQAALAAEMCARFGIGVVRYTDPAQCQDAANKAYDYILGWNTSFSNVSGSETLIKSIIDGDASQINGVLLFVNKGTVVGAQAGAADDDTEPWRPDEESTDAVLEKMYGYIKLLGSSPCPSHC